MKLELRWKHWLQTGQWSLHYQTPWIQLCVSLFVFQWGLYTVSALLVFIHYSLKFYWIKCQLVQRLKSNSSAWLSSEPRQGQLFLFLLLHFGKCVKWNIQSGFHRRVFVLSLQPLWVNLCKLWNWVFFPSRSRDSFSFELIGSVDGSRL